MLRPPFAAMQYFLSIKRSQNLNSCTCLTLEMILIFYDTKNINISDWFVLFSSLYDNIHLRQIKEVTSSKLFYCYIFNFYMYPELRMYLQFVSVWDLYVTFIPKNISAHIHLHLHNSFHVLWLTSSQPVSDHIFAWQNVHNQFLEISASTLIS
jgi:hypothetical protein